jgi:hypothetical protein
MACFRRAAQTLRARSGCFAGTAMARPPKEIDLHQPAILLAQKFFI